MKNYLIISVIALLLFGCEKSYDGVIDPRNEFLSFRLVNIDMPDTVIYAQDDSVVTIVAEIQNAQSIVNLQFDIYNDAGDLINPSNEMKDNGDIVGYHDSTANDSKFSAFITFSNSDPNGDYYFRFNATDVNNENKLLGEKRLVYFNNQPSFPPIISNLSIPDSINREVNFVFSVQVSDGNGLSDIKGVYFELYRPDGSVVYSDPNTQTTKFLMFDDGDLNGRGDQTAGDGIYSFKNSFASTAQTGFWHFEFIAIDKSDSLSNKIVHDLLVK